MESAVTLPEDLYERLRLKSQQLDRTPDDVVADLVERYLVESDDSWRTEFEALLARPCQDGCLFLSRTRGRCHGSNH